MQNIIKSFRAFANYRLLVHKLDLAARYKNRNFWLPDVSDETLNSHKKKYTEELEEKISTFVNDNYPSLRTELEKIKDQYIKKLIL